MPYACVTWTCHNCGLWTEKFYYWKPGGVHVWSLPEGWWSWNRSKQLPEKSSEFFHSNQCLRKYLEKYYPEWLEKFDTSIAQASDGTQGGDYPLWVYK